MSIVESVAQQLSQARCQHCGELAFGEASGSLDVFDEVAADERAMWDLLLRAEETLRLRPTPALSREAAQAQVARCLETVQQVSAGRDEAQAAVNGLWIILKPEKKGNARRDLENRSQYLARVTAELEEARQAEANARVAQEEYDKYEARHGSLYAQALAARSELYQRIDELARRAQQVWPGWLKYVPFKKSDDIERKIAHTRAVLAYRRLWSVNDAVSPLGPNVEADYKSVKGLMRTVAENGRSYSFQGLAYLDFTEAKATAAPGAVFANPLRAS